MEYYNILNLRKEPFSNSPEPEFFFEAPRYISCLQKLELAVRLRRGLNVVIGDVGTGKTTLCRKLIQQLSVAPKDAQEIETHLLLDPSFDSTVGFLQTISLLIGITDLAGQENEWQLKEKIKNYLFNKGVNENKIVVLIIDEGQKIPESCIEILREFLNYETNSFKLLQIIIFAQLEFKKVLNKYKNLADRINYLHYLHNLKFRHMRQMIRYRLKVSRDFEEGPDIFTFWGMLAIYLATSGYPRKVVSLCHQTLLMLIIRGKNKADFFLVRDCINDMYSPLFRSIRWVTLSLVLVVAAAVFIFQDAATMDFYGKLSVSQLAFQTKEIFSAPRIPEPLVKTIPVNIPAENPAAQKMPVNELAAFPAASSPAEPAPSTGAPPPALVQQKSLPVPAIVPEQKIQDVKMPEFLGALSMKKGRTLWKTVENIYGEVTPEIMDRVHEVNPLIDDRNTIYVGQKIKFPSIPAAIKPMQEGNFIVVVRKGTDMKVMYDFFHDHTYREPGMPLLFLPVWNSREGMIFAVVLDKNFSDFQTAQDYLGRLPEKLKDKAQIIAHWEETSVFFNRQALKN